MPLFRPWNDLQPGIIKGIAALTTANKENCFFLPGVDFLPEDVYNNTRIQASCL
jgi:hypothetical protein